MRCLIAFVPIFQGQEKVGFLTGKLVLNLTQTRMQNIPCFTGPVNNNAGCWYWYIHTFGRLNSLPYFGWVFFTFLIFFLVLSFHIMEEFDYWKNQQLVKLVLVPSERLNFYQHILNIKQQQKNLFFSPIIQFS